MGFGTNLQYLRKLNGGMTQEKFAEKMNVSRQTISKWELSEVYPEMDKILEICDFFSCSMDQLIREDMTEKKSAYSEIRIETVKRFRFARYLIISPEPENDVMAHMQKWIQDSGLSDVLDCQPDIIGWDFPFLSPEQKNVYGLRGYVSACIIPKDFTPKCGGAEIGWQETNKYAMITITDPFSASFDLIPNAYGEIMAYLDKNTFKTKAGENIIPCYEREYEKDGVNYMDVYIAIDEMVKV